MSEPVDKLFELSRWQPYTAADGRHADEELWQFLFY